MREKQFTTEAKEEIIFCCLNKTNIIKELQSNPHNNESEKTRRIINFFKLFEDAPRESGLRSNDEKTLFKWMKKHSKKSYKKIKSNKNRIFLSMLDLIYENTAQEENIQSNIDMQDVKKLIEFYLKNNTFPSLASVSQKEAFLANVRTELINAYQNSKLDSSITKKLLKIDSAFLSNSDKNIGSFVFESITDLSTKEAPLPIQENNKEESKDKVHKATLDLENKDEASEPKDNRQEEVYILNFEADDPTIVGPNNDVSIQSLFAEYESTFVEQCKTYYDFYKKHRRAPKKGGSEGEIEEELLAWHRKYKRKRSESEDKVWNENEIGNLTPALLDIKEFKRLCIKREDNILTKEEKTTFNSIFSKRVYLLKKIEEQDYLQKKYSNMVPILELSFKERDSIMRENKFDIKN